MKLTKLSIGSEARVTNISGKNAATRRLMEMGVVPGVMIRLIKSAPFGDPIEIRLRGYHLAMRKSEAEAIEVSE